jgi:hypothetical protein
MPKEYIAKSAAERNLSLNNYPDESGATVWCWEDSDTHEASQQFASEEEALEAMHDGRLAWSYVNDDGYVIQSPIGTEIEPDEDDDELDVTEVGELLAELHWDSGGPGAGAGVVSMYGHNGKFYVSHDAGVDEYETAEEALERNGFLRDSGANTSVWIHPELQIATPLRAGSGDPDSAMKDWPRLADFEQSERGYNEYQNAWSARKRRTTQLSQIPMAAIQEHRRSITLAREQGWQDDD